MTRIFIGTSGWAYEEWAEDFYRGVKPKDYLRHYAGHFPTVEINATFYHLPELKQVHGWRDKVPAAFRFAVKGSRFITHIQRLENPGGALGRFVRRLRPLGAKLGPLLWQLPPSLEKDLPRLKQFLRRLSPTVRQAIEFRHPSWLTPETMDLLRAHGAAIVSVSSRRMPADFSVTAEFVYVRFHGLAGGARHDYTPEELRPWAEHLRAQAAAGKEAFAYFNNDLNARAPRNARLLMELCGDWTAHPAPSDETTPHAAPTSKPHFGGQ
jgi:uncharacterized protein YecE (DUF72 family)